MKISLDLLQVLDSIDRKGSFAGAAQELFYVPSAITYLIRKLERDLKVKIFEKEGRRAKLTPIGRRLLEDGRHLLRLAEALENRVKYDASGWESELKISYEGLFNFNHILTIAKKFCSERPCTNLTFREEILNGGWDSLIHKRSHLSIGVTGVPPQAGYQTKFLLKIKFVFAVAPEHPLAKKKNPLSPADITPYPAVVIADTSRFLQPRTTGALEEQTLLTVPNLQAKVEAQSMGLGVGFIPEFIAEKEVAAKHLIIKAVKEPKQDAFLHLAWEAKNKGKALAWFIDATADSVSRLVDFS